MDDVRLTPAWMPTSPVLCASCLSVSSLLIFHFKQLTHNLYHMSSHFETCSRQSIILHTTFLDRCRTQLVMDQFANCMDTQRGVRTLPLQIWLVGHKKTGSHPGNVYAKVCHSTACHFAETHSSTLVADSSTPSTNTSHANTPLPPLSVAAPTVAPETAPAEVQIHPISCLHVSCFI